MHILEIVLFGINGRRNILKLRQGTNIISGAPSTGKSALIDIIEYCLGKGSYSIPRGPIREKISWFGLKLQFPSGEQMFVARRNRSPDEDITSEAYFEQGDIVNTPETAPEKPNSTIDAIVKTITQKIRISPNLLVPPPMPTYEPGQADVKHALFFCFLRQDEIAQQGTLFHRQGMPGIFATIRNVLPYFLGAVKEDYLARKQDLYNERRKQVKLERELNEIEDLQGEGLSRAYSLLAQMRDLGIMADQNDPQNVEQFINLFSKYSKWNPVFHRATGNVSDAIPRLQREVGSLRKELSEKLHDLRAAQEFAEEAEGFKTELHYQEKRLESIELLGEEEYEHDTCPLCNQELEEPIPRADAIKESLKRVRDNLKITSREEPQLLRYLQNIESDILRIRREIGDKTEALSALIRRIEESQQDQDLIFQQSQLIGKINYWLENVRFRDDTIPIKKALLEVQETVKRLELELNDKNEKEQLKSILNLIGERMTEFARRLSLEHGDRPVRLDEKNLTVNVDFEDSYEPLTGIGSGRNWLGYHLVVILALHEYFIKHDRPVPRFIVLDQPSQVYFPRDREGKALPTSFSNLAPAGREAVLKMYNFIIGVVNDLNSQMQVIITDQADLDDAFFQAHIIAKWWDDALVPRDW